ncbi:MAG: hypothetical protein U0519_00820 [Candidatus Gracilibacteria bacterium]
MTRESKKNSAGQSSQQAKKIVATKRIGDTEESEQVENTMEQKILKSKKVLYTEIDDEVTSIYDKLKQLKMKNVYIVVPKRAIVFQSIVNLKILKRKAEDLEKNIYVITNDPNGIKLAKQVGLVVYDKLESQEHPSLVSGKFLEDQMNISPLKASVNALDDDTPIRQRERKFSISDLIRKGKKEGLRLLPKQFAMKKAKVGEGKNPPTDKGKLVLEAPNRQALVALVVVSVIILLTISYIALPGATIKLEPKSNVLQTSVNIVLADAEANRAELDTHPLHEIASYTITASIKRPLLYEATGKDFQGQNARGVITVINTSNQEWPLIPRTRFQTANNIVFRSNDYVTVPPQKDNTPGTIDIAVEADQVDALGQVVGDRGNVGAAKFFLPGLSAENQKKLYAESKAAMTGGKTIVSKHITKDDIEAAKQKLMTDLKNSAQAELQSAVAKKNESEKTNLVLLVGDKAFQTTEPRITVPANLENQKLESFEIQGELVATGIAYNRDELTNMLKTELKLKTNPEKRLVHIDEESLTYRIFEIDQSAKKVKLTATIKGVEEFQIDPEKENGERLVKKIKDHVVGHEIKEARDYVQNLPEINKATIDSWPAWAPTMPNVPDNIKIEVVHGDTDTE